VLLGRAERTFWQDESYDHLVRTDEEFRRIQQYIEHNPVTAGLVLKPEGLRLVKRWAACAAAAGSRLPHEYASI